MRLKNKIAVITGAASGMGRAMALRFILEGAQVVGADIAESFGDLPELAGGRFVGVRCNVADRAACEALIDKAVALHGGIDILCNNAGVMDLFQGPADVTDAIWRRVMSINVDGPMFLTRHALPLMIKRGGGSIVNTASVAGLSGAAAGTAYVVSKHALIGLTRSTAWMHALQNIRCNAVAAGAVNTNIMASTEGARLDETGFQRTQGYHALTPRFLEPSDIADLALFLASDESKHINGAVIPADAGWLAA